MTEYERNSLDRKLERVYALAEGFSSGERFKDKGSTLRKVLRLYAEQLSGEDRKRLFLDYFGRYEGIADSFRNTLSSDEITVFDNEYSGAFLDFKEMEGFGAEFSGGNAGLGAEFSGVFVGVGAVFNGIFAGNNAEFSGILAGWDAEFSGWNAGWNAEFKGFRAGAGAKFKGLRSGWDAEFSGDCSGRGAKFSGDYAGRGAKFSGILAGWDAEFSGWNAGWNAEFGGKSGKAIFTNGIKPKRTLRNIGYHLTGI